MVGLPDIADANDYNGSAHQMQPVLLFVLCRGLGLSAVAAASVARRLLSGVRHVLSTFADLARHLARGFARLALCAVSGVSAGVDADLHRLAIRLDDAL